MIRELREDERRFILKKYSSFSIWYKAAIAIEVLFGGYLLWFLIPAGEILLVGSVVFAMLLLNGIFLVFDRIFSKPHRVVKKLVKTGRVSVLETTVIAISAIKNYNPWSREPKDRTGYFFEVSDLPGEECRAYSWLGRRCKPGDRVCVLIAENSVLNRIALPFDFVTAGQLGARSLFWECPMTFKEIRRQPEMGSYVVHKDETELKERERGMVRNPIERTEGMVSNLYNSLAWVIAICFIPIGMLEGNFLMFVGSTLLLGYLIRKKRRK